MSGRWQISVQENAQIVLPNREIDGPLVVGRQKNQEPEPYHLVKENGEWRLVIAPLSNIMVPREHARIESLENGRVRIRNLHNKLPIPVLTGQPLAAGATVDLDPPVRLAFDKRILSVQPVGGSSTGSMFSLAAMPAPPGRSPGHAPSPTLLMKARTITTPEMESNNQEMVRWFRAAMDVLQAAAGSLDFFHKAARALVEMVDMDVGHVLLYENGVWRSTAHHAAVGRRLLAGQEAPSQTVLNQVLTEKRTFWTAPDVADSGMSLAGVEAVAAAPVLDGRGEVIGALYCERKRGGMGGVEPLTSLEASLVELLASGVAAGLARIEQEKAALSSRVQFEQFFTPELAHHLAAQPDLLQGRDATISVLFCDIRSFSRFANQLGPERAVAWVGSVMEALSVCVLKYHGVVVDYIGDELMAMWGAPQAQPDHAELACKAALDMLAVLPELNRQWTGELGGPMNIGIGINTGFARVGNVGSTHKFKYGPLGNTVNVGSRVQGCTKYLKVNLLVTEATRACLSNTFQVRRVGKVGLVNIAEPVTLCELSTADRPNWSDLAHDYEAALDHFERKEFRDSAHLLGNLLLRHPQDGPSLVLLSRSVQALIDPESFDPVYHLAK